MADIDELLAFLADRDINPQRPAQSPWPEYRPEMGELMPIDYSWLFPTKGERTWSMEDVREAVDQIMDPLEPDSSGRQGSRDDGGTDDSAGRGVADWDTCAWYQQIHFYGSDWGIYIRQDCLIRQAQRIYHRAVRGLSPSPPLALEALVASLAVYFLHEHFHHKAESLAIRLQVVEPSVQRYPDYFYDVYSRTLGSDACLEEALANADSWRRLNEQRHKRTISLPVRSATRRYLEARFPLDPPGYRKAADYFAEPNFRQGLYLLSSQIDEATAAPSRAKIGRLRDWYWAPQMTRSIFSWSSRIHLIVPRGSRPALPSGPLRHIP